jgi:chromosome partitioning protein
MPTVVAVINQKGGVGKTTSAMNLGAALAEKGRKVLLVDLDPQGNLTSHAGVELGEDAATVYDVLLGEATLREALAPAGEPNIWVAPSTIDLAAAEIELAPRERRDLVLRDALEVLKADGDKGAAPKFDDVLIDCPPSLGLLSLNALAAADSVIVPMQAEFFALQGMAKLMEVVDLVRKRLNPRLRFDGVVACKVDRRPKLTQEVLDEIRTHFPDKLYDTVIRPNVKLAEAPSFGRSVLAYAGDSNGADDYRTFAAEHLKRTKALVAAAAAEAAAATAAKRAAASATLPPPA